MSEKEKERKSVGESKKGVRKREKETVIKKKIERVREEE